MRFNVRMKQHINISLRFNEDLKLYADFKNILSRIKRDYFYDTTYNCTMDYLPRIGEKVRIPIYNDIIDERFEIKDIVHCMYNSNIVNHIPNYELEYVELILSKDVITVDGLDYLTRFSRIFLREDGMFVPPTSVEDWILDIQRMKSRMTSEDFMVTTHLRWK